MQVIRGLWTHPGVTIVHIHNFHIRLGRARVFGWPVWRLILGSGLADSLDPFAELFGHRELGGRAFGLVRGLGLWLGAQPSYRLGLSLS